MALLGFVVALLMSSGLSQEKPEATKSTTAKKTVAIKKTPQQEAAEAKRVLALDLMNRCHALSIELTSLQRINLLNPLILSAGWVGDKRQARQWAHEMFDLGHGEDPELGLAAQLQAVSALSNFDAGEAMSMFQRVDFATLGSFPKGSPRQIELTYGTHFVFVRYAQQKGKAAMPRILEAAATLGENGDFPYIAGDDGSACPEGSGGGEKHCWFVAGSVPTAD